MKICFVADAGSPIALNWIGHFVEAGHEVHLISSRPIHADELPGVRSYVVPLAFMGVLPKASKNLQSAPKVVTTPSSRSRGLRNSKLWGVLSAARYNLSSVELHRQVPKARTLIREIAPDIVHAMRIPFEGIVAAKATPPRTPLIVSVWGNDFTLFAENSLLIGRQTRQAMRRTDGLLSDCERDDRLAREWGFSPTSPSRVIPGAGGIKTDVFHPGEADAPDGNQLRLPRRELVVINPRGYRAYVPLDPFFQSVRMVVDRHPGVVFLCTGLESNPTAERWVAKLGLTENVRLLGRFDQAGMANLYRLAAVSVSPSLHDGTPNTLLESMASGCFPVAGNIESVREWIDHGVNGLLGDPQDPRSMSEVLCRALSETTLRDSARVVNLRIIGDRAEYGAAMSRAEDYYREIIGLNRMASKG